MADLQYNKQYRDVRAIFRKAMWALSPVQLLREQVKVSRNAVTVQGECYDLNEGQDVWVFGSGKAAPQMAAQLERMLGDRIKDGMVIGPYGTKTHTKYIQQFEASHPLPNADSEAATYEFVELAGKVKEDDLVLYCLTGGTSSLLCLPAGKLEVSDLVKTYRLLLKSGCDIHEMNIVRKHLSRVKGGRLVSFFGPGRLIDLVISDVPDDRLESIGSGPTTSDDSTFEQAFQILKRHQIWEDVPHAVRAYIAKGMHEELETGGTAASQLLRHESHIIGSARKLAEKAAVEARSLGYHSWVADQAYNDAAHNVAEMIVKQAKSVWEHDEPVAKPAALVYFGESTVKVTGNGLGGRNQELALVAARQIKDLKHITILSAGTDGQDGPTDAAGAICNGQTVSKAKGIGLNPEQFLKNNDSYSFFDRLNALLKTGPTGNNLMDLQIVLVSEK